MATAGQELRATQYNLDTQQITALGRRNSDSSASTASSPQTGVIRLPGVAVTLGYTYVVEVNCHLKSSVASDIIEVSIRHTTDGTTPTVSSTVLPGGSFSGNVPTNASHQESKTWRVPYTPAADLTLAVLVAIGRIGGSGNCILEGSGNYETMVSIWNAGLAVTDTGVDL